MCGERRQLVGGPLGGVVRDGYVWGRGAIDMKGDGVVHLLAMLALKRSGVPLNRDIVYIANADEELGSTGAVAFVDRHADCAGRGVPDQEGGDIPMENGRCSSTAWAWRKSAPSAAAARRGHDQRVGPRARTGAADGGRLAASRSTRRRWRSRPAWRSTSATSRATTRASSAPGCGRAHGPGGPAGARVDLADVYWNAILRNTISLTVLTGRKQDQRHPGGGHRRDRHPPLPTTNPDSMLATLKAIAADSGTPGRRSWRQDAAGEPVDTDLFRAIERAGRSAIPARGHDADVHRRQRPAHVPRLGIITYGIDTFRVENAEHQKMMHGNDERISIENRAGARGSSSTSCGTRSEECVSALVR